MHRPGLILLLALAGALGLPRAGYCLWSPPPAGLEVVEQVQAYGAEVEMSSLAGESYVAPGGDGLGGSASSWRYDVGTQSREIIRTPELPGLGGPSFSRVDVEAVKLADVRKAEREGRAEALDSGVTIPEPGLWLLLLSGFAALMLLRYRDVILGRFP